VSTPETPIVESKSSVKVVRNAKGEPQWEVKVVVGDDESVLNDARRIAVAQYQALGRELR
jgi:hypothetical protein